MRKLLIPVATGLALLASGCANKEKSDEYRGSMLNNLPFVYQMTVQQGNIVTEEMVSQLEPGLTKTQVQFLLGTPLLADMFHIDRWDYIYTIRRGHQPMEAKRLTLWFQDDALVKIEGNPKPDMSRPQAIEEEREIVVKVPDWQDNRGLINRTLNTIGLETADQ